MPDQEPQTVTNSDGNDGGDGDGGDPTRAYWAEFDKRVAAGIERGVESALGKLKKSQPVGTSRSGRHSLPAILSDIVFGPPKDGD